MSEFFDTTSPEPPRPHVQEPPPWEGPPFDIVAGLVPVRQVLARTDRVSVVLTHIDAFPTGASLRVRATVRQAPGMTDEEWHELHNSVFGPGRHGSPSRTAPELLRVGVEFSDGRRATNLDHGWTRPQDWFVSPPSEPSLVEHGGGGSGHERHFTRGSSLWLWPLPPAEPFDLVVEWPIFDIPVTRTSIDGAAIVAAAERSEPAWPRD